jgi:hypothetical protein
MDEARLRGVVEEIRTCGFATVADAMRPAAGGEAGRAAGATEKDALARLAPMMLSQAAQLEARGRAATAPGRRLHVPSSSRLTPLWCIEGIPWRAVAGD